MQKQNDKKYYNYLGAIHIHSNCSDGSGDINLITKAAKKAGLAWIIITDHDNMDIEEGVINGVCVIKGEEISGENENGMDANHYLALGINKVIDRRLGLQNSIEEVREQGGFGFAAHPDESYDRNNSSFPIRWSDKNIKPDGIEIWNWFSTWADNYSDKNIFTQAYAFLFRHELITTPKEVTLKWWDDLNNASEFIIPAIGGVDAHALIIKDYIIPLTIFPYSSMFKTITNVISLEQKLSNDFLEAKAQILNSLKNGNNLIVNRHLCKTIPEITIEHSRLKIKLTKKFNVRILLNGNYVFDRIAKEVEFSIDKKGKYRIEITSGKLGYAYSNPIVVK